jgi:hypothetical protein
MLRPNHFSTLQELAASVLKGLAESLSQFTSLASPGTEDLLADPSERATFERCRLEPSERNADNPVYRFHRDPLALRRSIHSTTTTSRCRRRGACFRGLRAAIPYRQSVRSIDHRKSRT